LTRYVIGIRFPQWSAIAVVETDRPEAIDRHAIYGSDASHDPHLRRQAMSYTVSELLLRNLRDVFGENDPARRRAAIHELYNEECVFYDPNKGAHRGRDAIDRIAGIIKATHPDYQYQPIGAPEELGDAARCRWVSGTPGKAPAYAGTDFVIARNGRIAAVYLFFDGPGDPSK
jgi:SnoaL-like domain